MAGPIPRRSTNILLAVLLHAIFANAQNGDGGATSGYSNSDLGAAGTGAEGSSSSAANLSKGAIVAISVVVALVVVGAGKFYSTNVPSSPVLTTLSDRLRTLLPHKETTMETQREHSQDSNECSPSDDTKNTIQNVFQSPFAKIKQGQAMACSHR